MRRAAVIAIVLAGLAGCRDDAKPAPSQGEAPAALPATETAPGYTPSGERPVDPRRPTPPPALARDAIAVGATAPAFELAGTTGPVRLADALADKERVLLVFYRGDW